MGCQSSSRNNVIDEAYHVMAQSINITKYNLTKAELEFIHGLYSNEHMFVLCDPAQKDCPMVYVSEKFVEMTEYPAGEIVGRNCRFLQGKNTTPESVEVIRVAMKTQKPAAVCLLNYSKTGRQFYNYFYIAPLFDKSHNLSLYIGIQTLMADQSYLNQTMDPTKYLETNVSVFRKLMRLNANELAYRDLAYRGGVE
jgi:hypothetical protein